MGIAKPTKPSAQLQWHPEPAKMKCPSSFWTTPNSGRSYGPSGLRRISFVHSGRVLRAELALCALVERNGAGVLTEGRRRWPARLKILGLRLRSGDREFDVRGADVEKPSSARNPKDKPAWLGVRFFDHKRARDGGAIVVAGATAPGWTCAGGFFKSSSSQVKSRRGVAMRKTA